MSKPAGASQRAANMKPATGGIEMKLSVPESIGSMMRRNAIAGLAGLAGLAMLAGSQAAISQPAAAVEPAKKITIGNNGVYPTYYSLIAASDRGLFKDAGIEVELLGMKDDSTCLRALIGRSIDACVVNVDGVIRV